MAARHAARTGKKVGHDPIVERILTSAVVTLLGVFLVVASASSWSYVFHSVLVVLGLLCLVGAWDVLRRKR
jgi:hypothetical protein